MVVLWMVDGFNIWKNVGRIIIYNMEKNIYAIFDYISHSFLFEHRPELYELKVIYCA